MQSEALAQHLITCNHMQSHAITCNHMQSEALAQHLDGCNEGGQRDRTQDELIEDDGRERA